MHLISSVIKYYNKAKYNVQIEVTHNIGFHCKFKKKTVDTFYYQLEADKGL